MLRFFSDIKKSFSRLLGKKNKYYSYLGYYYYDRLANRYSCERSYLNLISELESKKQIPTDINIRLSKDFNRFDVSVKEVMGKFGKPYYKVKQKKDIFEIDVMFYRLHIGKYKTKLELHFYKNRLFFFCYTFSYIKPEGANEILHIMKEKYLNSNNIDLNTEYILDEEKNTIELSQDVDFSINYISTSSRIFSDLKERHNFIKYKKEFQIKKNREILKKRL